MPIDKKFLNSAHAIMVPHTTDGRVLFAVPWLNHVILGTTDTQTNKPLIEPKALNQEIDFIISNAGRYMTKKPKKEDIKSVFVGLRPLAISNNEKESTKEICDICGIYLVSDNILKIL